MINGFPEELIGDDGLGNFALRTTATIAGDVTITGTGLATEEKQNDEIAAIGLLAKLTETQPVSLATIPLATDAAKESKQLPNNHQVTVSNPTTNPETGLAKDASLNDGGASAAQLLTAIAGSTGDTNANTNTISNKLSSNDAIPGSIGKKLDDIAEALNGALIEQVIYSGLTNPPFQVGEMLSGSIVGTIGQIGYDNGVNTLEVMSSATITDGEIITGGTSGATATVVSSVILPPSYAQQSINRQDIAITKDLYYFEDVGITPTPTVFKGDGIIPGKFSVFKTDEESVFKDITDNISWLKKIKEQQTDGSQKTQVTQLQDVVSAIGDGVGGGGNSTNTPLGAGATFTGLWEDVTKFNSISVIAKSDVGSAINGLKIQFSTNGTDVDLENKFTITNLSSRQVSVSRQAKYVRIVYTNGGLAQTYFRLQTIFGSTAIPTNSTVITDNDTELSAPTTIADDMPNPTTSSVGANNLIYNSVDNNWDRDRGLIYGSDDLGVTRRVIKTDDTGAIQVDLDVASVEVNNGAGAAAVNIQDGGNSITVDNANLNIPLTNLDAKLASILAKQGNIVDMTKTVISNAANNSLVDLDGNNLAVVVRGSDNVAIELATSTKQSNGSQKTQITDSSNNNVATIKPADTTPLSADPALVVALSPNGNQATESTLITINEKLDDITNGNQSTKIRDEAGDLINPLTEETFTSFVDNQVPQLAQENGGNLSLIYDNIANINTNTPAQGEALMANSSPVVIASDQTPIPVTLPTGEQTITSTNVTADGSVGGGATSVIFDTDAAFAGTINGLTREASAIYGFEAAAGKTLPQINYTITAGSINIDTIV